MSGETLNRLGPYILLEQVGEGAMGVVWKATDTRLGRTVALKLLPGSFAADSTRLAWFDHEARALATLQHPGIVTVYSFEEVGGQRLMTMEFVDGEQLTRAIPESGIPLARFFEMAVPLAEAVRAAHAHGIAHRDLKPANILVTRDGEIKVLDFGIAQFLRMPSRPGGRSPAPTGQRSGGEEPPTEALDSPAGTVVGTPPYMSPEQALGQSVDQRTDVFSLGIIFYLMLTGQRPFPGETTADVMHSLVHDTPLPLDQLRTDIPAVLSRIVDRCLAKEPDARFQSAAGIHGALIQARAALAAADVGLRSVAVLPFDDLSPERDQQHFCEGVADEIVLVLTRVKGLRVASRTEAFLARATIRQAREIGERLGVEAILEGSVRGQGGKLRVGVALVDVATGSHLWAERFDGEAGDIFSIQDTIASRVAEALRGPLSPRDHQEMRQTAPPQIQAYDFYLRGRQFFQRCSRRGLEFALGMYNRAIEIDPGYARAHAGIANAHAFLYLHAGRLDEHRRAAAAAAARALELAPDSAEAHAAHGLALSLDGKQEDAEHAFQTALSLNPGLFEACYFFARMRFMQGRQAEAIELFERAAAIRPDDYQAPLLVAQVHDDMGQPGRALASRRLGTVRAEEHLKLHPDDTRALYMGANGFVALGEAEKGLAWARRALDIEPDESMVLYNVACVYSLAGLVGPALDCLERAVANGLNVVAWVKHDSNLDAIRSDPRYAQLVASLEASQP